MASNIQLHRLAFLDNEITRYRDYEWKTATFYNAFLAAVFFVFIDADHRKEVDFLSWGTVLAVWFLVVLAIYHLIYVHHQLNKRRLERHRLYETLGVDDHLGDWSPKFVLILYEGPGFWMFFSIVAILVLFGMLDTIIILHKAAATTCPALPGPMALWRG